jgi:eukaryotic-like serine/threonine-protein kinase
LAWVVYGMNKEDLAIEDFVDNITQFIAEPIYYKIYEDYDERFQKIFTYLHKNLNDLFSHMNYKNEYNKHYNADESRELLSIIRKLDDLRAILTETENEIEINENYLKVIDRCRNFLKQSGGSTIPDDFENIEIIRYESVFRLTKKVIKISKSKTTKITTIGEGAFSIVYKYKDENYNRTFALKRAKKGLSERDLQRLKKEFEILKSLNYPYILEVYRYDDSENSYSMELCDCTLDQYISKQNGNPGFTSEKRKNIALQFLTAITYLHSKGHLHRDISYKNVLLKLYDNDLIVVKLSDFGLVKEKGSEFTLTDSSLKGTIIDVTLKSCAEYNLTNEIYTIGMILNFIFTARKNFHNDNSDISKIVQKCINTDVKQRYEDVTSIINALRNAKKM